MHQMCYNDNVSIYIRFIVRLPEDIVILARHVAIDQRRRLNEVIEDALELYIKQEYSKEVKPRT